MQVATVRTVTRRRRKKREAKPFSSEMLVKLYELLQGERDSVILFSKALGEKIRFFNPATETEEMRPDLPSYSTRELAFVLSMTQEEFYKYHYLKTHLA